MLRAPAFEAGVAGSSPAGRANFPFGSPARADQTVYCRWDKGFRGRTCSSKAPFPATDVVRAEAAFYTEIRPVLRVLKSAAPLRSDIAVAVRIGLFLLARSAARLPTP